MVGGRLTTLLLLVPLLAPATLAAPTFSDTVTQGAWWAFRLQPGQAALNVHATFEEVAPDAALGRVLLTGKGQWMSNAFVRVFSETAVAHVDAPMDGMSTTQTLGPAGSGRATIASSCVRCPDEIILVVYVAGSFSRAHVGIEMPAEAPRTMTSGSTAGSWTARDFEGVGASFSQIRWGSTTIGSGQRALAVDEAFLGFFLATGQGSLHLDGPHGRMACPCSFRELPPGQGLGAGDHTAAFEDVLGGEVLLMGASVRVPQNFPDSGAWP